MGVSMTVSESNDDNNAVHSEQVNRKKVQTRLRRDIARVLIRVSQQTGGTYMLTGYMQEKLQTQKDLIENLF